MICVFPDPYPDELLYSACARYSALMRYPNKARAIVDFFGIGASAIVDLPGRINHLIRALPPNHLYTADELIDKHTLFPFYSPFLPRERARLIREAMRSDDCARVATQLRKTISGSKTIYLRFCPECVKEDRTDYGETYWHRLHQLHGVDVCTRHNVFLEDSDATWQNYSNAREAKAAELFVYATPSRKVDKSNRIDLIHIRIGTAASFFLDNVRDSVDCDLLSRRYKDLLLRQGLAYYNGQVRTTKLITMIKEYYPAEILSKFGCDINTERSWVNRLLSERQRKDVQHPICHILLLVCLNHTAEEILDHFTDFKPFGEGPWPCLNPAMDHYKKPQVLSCKITPGAKKDRGKPRGIFSCSCGFTYARVGPDTKESDRFTYSIVQAYGDSWESLLRELWNDMSLTIYTVAHRLGVSITTLKRRVVVHGLRFPRSIKGSRNKVEIIKRYKLHRQPRSAVLQKKKKELLELVASNPKASRSELWKSEDSLLLYIQRAEPEWLDKHLPARRKGFVPHGPKVDWTKEDIAFAEEVSRAVDEIYALEIPTRISVKAISQRVGKLHWIRQYLDKLPQTAEILNSHLESREAFLVRRIKWVEEAFRREQIVPTKTAFVGRALINRYVASGNEAVCRAMKEALLRLGTNGRKRRR